MRKEIIPRAEIELCRREFIESNLLVRIEDAAMMMATSVSTVKRRIDEGRLVAYNDNRTNKGIKLLASDLKDYISAMRQDMKDSA